MIDQYSPVVQEWLNDVWIWIMAGVAALGTWAVINEANTRNSESRIQSKVNKAESLSDSNTCNDSSNNNNSSKKEANKDDSSTNSKRHTPDQEALGDLAKEAMKKWKSGNPISKEEAEIFDKWAEEYGVDQHHQTGGGDPGHWKGGDGQPHTHWNGKHIPYAD